jgi:hypothetical protein
MRFSCSKVLLWRWSSQQVLNIEEVTKVGWKFSKLKKILNFAERSQLCRKFLKLLKVLNVEEATKVSWKFSTLQKVPNFVERSQSYRKFPMFQ